LFVKNKLPKNSFSWAADVANFILEKIYCQQLIFRHSFCPSYVGKKFNRILESLFG